MILSVEPNPVIVSKTGHIHNNGTVDIKNNGSNKCIFSVEFNTEIFCGISPACGELIPGESRTLKFSFEDTIRDNEELSFLVRFTSVSPTEVTNLAEIVALSKTWPNMVKCLIKFSTHAEDALRSVAFSIKSKPSLSQVLQRSERRDIDGEQREMLQRKIIEKKNQRNQLTTKIRNLEREIAREKANLQVLTSKADSNPHFVLIGIVLLIVAFIVKYYR